MTSAQLATASQTSSLHQTPLGEMRAFWTAAGLSRLQWPAGDPGADDAEKNEVPEACESLAQRFEVALQEYFRGNFSALDEIPLDSRHWSPFFGEVYRLCRQIPAGQTMTYAELADQAGSARAARAVGQAMAQNRIPLVIPCHRVLASGGGLGGYSGPGQLETKAWLLAWERRDEASTAANAATT